MAMQGDAYYLPLSGSGFTLDEVELIEFVIGQLRKTYPGEVGYDEDNALFLFPLTQQETYLLSGQVTGQARVKFKNAQGGLGTSFYVDAVQRSAVRTVL